MLNRLEQKNLKLNTKQKYHCSRPNLIIKYLIPYNDIVLHVIFVKQTYGNKIKFTYYYYILNRMGLTKISTTSFGPLRGG